MNLPRTFFGFDAGHSKERRLLFNYGETSPEQKVTSKELAKETVNVDPENAPKGLCEKVAETDRLEQGLRKIADDIRVMQRGGDLSVEKREPPANTYTEITKDSTLPPAPVPAPESYITKGPEEEKVEPKTLEQLKDDLRATAESIGKRLIKSEGYFNEDKGQFRGSLSAIGEILLDPRNAQHLDELVKFVTTDSAFDWQDKYRRYYGLSYNKGGDYSNVVEITPKIKYVKNIVAPRYKPTEPIQKNERPQYKAPIPIEEEIQKNPKAPTESQEVLKPKRELIIDKDGVMWQKQTDGFWRSLNERLTKKPQEDSFRSQAVAVVDEADVDRLWGHIEGRDGNAVKGDSVITMVNGVQTEWVCEYPGQWMRLELLPMIFNKVEEGSDSSIFRLPQSLWNIKNWRTEVVLPGEVKLGKMNEAVEGADGIRYKRTRFGVEADIPAPTESRSLAGKKYELSAQGKTQNFEVVAMRTRLNDAPKVVYSGMVYEKMKIIPAFGSFDVGGKSLKQGESLTDKDITYTRKADGTIALSVTKEAQHGVRNFTANKEANSFQVLRNDVTVENKQILDDPLKVNDERILTIAEKESIPNVEFDGKKLDVDGSIWGWIHEGGELSRIVVKVQKGRISVKAESVGTTKEVTRKLLVNGKEIDVKLAPVVKVPVGIESLRREPYWQRINPADYSLYPNGTVCMRKDGTAWEKIGYAHDKGAVAKDGKKTLSNGFEGWKQLGSADETLQPHSVIDGQDVQVVDPRNITAVRAGREFENRYINTHTWKISESGKWTWELKS